MFKSSKREIHDTDTLIGQGTEFEGKMKCVTNLRVEGKFSGELECTQNVTIGESGIIHSNIAAADVYIAGKVFGDINAKGKLVILPSGQIEGNIQSTSIIIHEGAHFNGTSKMNRTSTHTEQRHTEKTHENRHDAKSSKK